MKVREILKDFNSWSYQFRYEILIIYFEDIKCSESKMDIRASVVSRNIGRLNPL